MRFHCLMVVRDERDILAQNLAHLLSWSDGIYILDSGSTDGSWELVQDLARTEKRIVPFQREALMFNDGLRGLLFHQFRDRFDSGDWVLRTDCDEFYQIAPPDFVAQHLNRGETAVSLQWYYFRLLRREVQAYETGRVDLAEDRKLPIEQRRRHYKISEYSEPRMFRYRPRIKWSERESFPYHAGFMARERIPIRHYPHRDPPQMHARFDLRARVMCDSPFKHWKLANWRDEIVDEHGNSESSAAAEKRGLSGENGIDSGPLYFWEPGTAFPARPTQNQFSSSLKRLAQRIVHPLLLPLLDRNRRAWNPAFQPQRLESASN